MYTFEAKYIDYMTDEERYLLITFDCQFFNNEKDCYMEAMSRAFDNRKESEAFCSLEFVCC